jgi:hypothetical protein
MATGRSGERPRAPDCYDLDVRPVGEADTDWLGDDSLVVGVASPRWGGRLPSVIDKLPRIPIVATLGLLVVALLVAVAISAGHPSRTVVAAPTTADAPPPQQLSASQLSLASLIAAAESSIPLQDYAIEDNGRSNCRPSAADGTDPAKVIASVVLQDEPDYRLRDTSKGIEQSGTCSVQARFASPDGTVLMLTVLPPAGDFAEFVALSTNGNTSAMDIVTNVGGWHIEIGAVGSPDTLPSQRDLTTIATDIRLQWSAAT